MQQILGEAVDFFGPAKRKAVFGLCVVYVRFSFVNMMSL